jgi:DNA-binding MarR family transcriptional regulator
MPAGCAKTSGHLLLFFILFPIDNFRFSRYYIVVRYNEIRCIETRYIESRWKGSLMAQKNIEKYLPLTESTYYIMLALVEPLHGYGVMQKVEEMSEGAVKLGPGTLYGVFSTLEKEALIVKTGEEERRKYYALTEKGRHVLALQVERLQVMARSGRLVVDRFQQ